MALKVWLPLNGDLKNYGCSNIEVTNNGATIDDAGKIGKCYSFDGTNDNLSFTPNVDSLSKISIALWICPANDTPSGVMFSLEYTNYWQFTLNGTSVYIRDSSAGRTGTRKSYSMGSFTANVWTHIAVTYDTGTLKIYKNGILYSTNTVGGTSLNTGITNGRIGSAVQSGYYYAGKLNDVRIYDHCLSAAEVKEISQGLVLHYKLTNELFGNPNLYTGTEKFTGSWSNNNSWTTSTEIYQNFVVKQKSSTWGGLYQDISCTQGDIFTISFYGKVDSGGTIVSVHRSNLGNVTTGLSLLDGNFSTGTNWVTATDNGTAWKRYWATIQIASSDVTTLKWRLENSIANKTFYICGIKLERGSIATAWCPADSEMTINRTTAEDSSGYNHNGTIVNDFIYSPDSPRYNQSINLKNGNSMIDCGRGGMVTDSITVNMWIKASSWANPVSCTESGGWNFESNSSTLTFPIYLTDLGYAHTKNGPDVEIVAPATVADNTWHMLTGVYDRIGQTVKLYVDGELKQQNTVSAPKLIKYHSSNSIWIGGEATASSAINGMAGLFSDFRIYCTPLLDNDIKLLYNIGMKVDNGHELHCFELKESTNNRELLQGVNIVSSYISHTNLRRPYSVNSNGELYFSTSDSAGTTYIPIIPTGHTYYYDIEVSIDANNQFYLGFERYDANKTSRQNSATVYVINVKPTTALSHKRYCGTVDLSTDGVNPCAFIALRILNGWSSTTGTATIHKLSLREVTTLQNPKLYKTGTFLTDEFNEHQRASFYNNGFVESTEFIEM